MATEDSIARRLDTSNLNHVWAQLLVEELVRSGVTTFFLAPGSRSTPLTAAVARHPTAQSIVHVDERGSAFAALGYGRSTGQPAGWVTTSGTAVANGWPAVVEASVDGVPMLLLTGDRPPELRDTGANQTIDQVKIYGDYVRWQVDLPTPSTDIDPEMVLTTADQAAYRARRVPPGPVHCNCMFRKPLAALPDEHSYGDYLSGLQPWMEGTTPYTQYKESPPTPAEENVRAVVDQLRDVERGCVVAGHLNTNAEAAAALDIAEQLEWPLLPDVRSRLRLGASPGNRRVPYVDQLLASESFRETHAPEAILHVGGRFVSKRLRQFIAAARPNPYVLVRPDPNRLDPDHRVTHRIESKVETFREIALSLPWDETGEVSSWTTSWREASDRTADTLAEFAGNTGELSEPLVARLVAQHVPADHALVLASSMPVRDVNRYAVPDGARIPVFANRGASGIDGTVATATGVAVGHTGPATLVIGDLALLHDLNGLGLAADHPVVIIAVNNDGGGIFHFLPIADEEDVFEPYFATPQGRTFEHAAAMYDLDYARPETPETFVDVYQRAASTESATLIEVQTDREANHALHEELEQRIARAVDAA